MRQWIPSLTKTFRRNKFGYTIGRLISYLEVKYTGVSRNDFGA